MNRDTLTESSNSSPFSKVSLICSGFKRFSSCNSSASSTETTFEITGFNSGTLNGFEPSFSKNSATSSSGLFGLVSSSLLMIIHSPSSPSINTPGRSQISLWRKTPSLVSPICINTRSRAVNTFPANLSSDWTRFTSSI